MKKMRKKILHAFLILSLAGAVGLAFNAGRSLFAEDEMPEGDVPAMETMDAMDEAAPEMTPVPPAPEPLATSGKPEYVGAETCAACHMEHVEAFQTGVHGKGLEKYKGISSDKSCETCHGPGSAHVNAGGDKTDPGFASVTVFKKMSAKEVSQTCFECHKDADKAHWTGGDHERANVSCVSCHSIHSPMGKKALLAKKDQADTCYQCHKNVKGQMRRSAHMPVEEGKMQCSSCHSPHGSATPKQLKASNLNQLCFSCHQDKRGPHLWEHIPVRENCGNCHHPHGSHHDKMLTAKMPFLCQRCHDYTRHPPTPYSAQDVANQHNRIFNSSCINCHPNIHGSNHPSGKTFLR